jgi:hypothetical protein
MVCDKCKKQISDDCKFCTYCGTKVEHKKEEGTRSNIKSDNVNIEVINHLEFLGYEVTENESSGANTNLFAKHKSRSNLWIQCIPNMGYSFVANYTINKEKVTKGRDKLLEVLNKVNGKTCWMCSISLNDDNESLMCSAWYPNKYNKSTFSDFIDLYERDINNAFKLQELLEFA